MPEVAPTRRRADAERSIEAILDAAVRVLCDRPEASVEDIAKSAGLTRQTVYAHFGSRESLLAAVFDRITDEVADEVDASDLDDSPTVAVTRLLDEIWRALHRYPFLLHGSVAAFSDSRERNPILDRLEGLIREGQAAGEFDAALSPSWCRAATLGLGRAAVMEVSSGVMTIDEATDAVRATVLRVLGITPR